MLISLKNLSLSLSLESKNHFSYIASVTPTFCKQSKQLASHWQWINIESPLNCSLNKYISWRKLNYLASIVKLLHETICYYHQPHGWNHLSVLSSFSIGNHITLLLLCSQWGAQSPWLLILTIIFLVVESLLNQHHVDCVLVAYLSRSYWSQIMGTEMGFSRFKWLISSLTPNISVLISFHL